VKSVPNLYKIGERWVKGGGFEILGLKYSKLLRQSALKIIEAERGTYRSSYFQRFLGDLFVVLVLLTYLLYRCLVGVVLLGCVGFCCWSGDREVSVVLVVVGAVVVYWYVGLLRCPLQKIHFLDAFFDFCIKFLEFFDLFF
jgi:hypothetical protein